MLNYTNHLLKKLETLFHSQGVKVRYEKGQFSSSDCVVLNKRVIVINRFLDTEGRCSTLIDVYIEMRNADFWDKENEAGFQKKLEKYLSSGLNSEK